MNVDLLEEFVALSVHGSFTSAARELHMSQPSLSRHIASFERELGQKLFFDTHPLTLTNSGEIVLRRATEILSIREAMLLELSASKSVTPECIRIHDMLHLESLYTGVFEAIAETKRAYPNVTFSFTRETSGLDVKEMLRQKCVHVAFSCSIDAELGDRPETPPGFKTIPIPDFHGELAFGVKKGSHLLKNGDLGFEDFKYATFLLPAKRSYGSFQQSFIAACRQEGFYPRIEYVSVDNQLEFYSRDPGESVFLITKMTNAGHTAFDERIRSNLTVISPRGKTYCIDAVMMVLDEKHSEAFSFFLSQVESIEKRRFDEGRAS